MKKLLMITLSLLLFTFFSPVQAKRPGPLDRPLPDYNNLSLRQIFEDGNELLNNIGDFEIDTDNDGYADGFATGNAITARSLSTDKNTGAKSQSITGTVGSSYMVNSTDIIVANGDKIYMNTAYKSVDGNVIRVILANNASASINYGSVTSISNGLWLRVSNLVSVSSTTLRILMYTTTVVSTVTTLYDSTFIINLTTLGISTATKIEMDNLYSEYVKYKNMMNATDVMLIVGQLGAFVWSLVVSFEVFGFVLWEYALFGIGAGFIGYLALKIIQKKAGDDNGNSD